MPESLHPTPEEILRKHTNKTEYMGRKFEAQAVIIAAMREWGQIQASKGWDAGCKWFNMPEGSHKHPNKEQYLQSLKHPTT